jgi:integrase
MAINGTFEQFLVLTCTSWNQGKPPNVFPLFSQSSAMVATIRIIQRDRPTPRGLYSLRLRITKDRSHSYISLGIELSKEDWDAEKQRVRKGHPNSARMNAMLQKKLAEATEQSLEVEMTKADATVKTVRQKIKPDSGQTFFPQADQYMTNLKTEGKYNQYSADKSRIERFKKYLKTDTAFQEITPHVLERFKAFVKAEFKTSERTAVNHLVAVRSVFSQAIKAGAVDAKHYPFGKGKVKIKFPDSQKLGLSADELARVEQVELDPKANHARNLWLFSFYFAGMRVSDVLRLRWADFQEDRLYYAMGKNLKGDSLKVPEKAMRILEQYKAQKSENNGLVFPELKDADFSNLFELKRQITVKNKSIAEYLQKQVAPKAEILKPLTMHIARHTFGNLSGDKIPIQMLQKLYRHSSVITTIGYQSNFIHKDTDDALEAVIGK